MPKTNNESNSPSITSPLGGADEPFIWVNEFNDDALIQFYKAFSALEQDTKQECIPIIISSYGGEVAVMLAMRDLIKSSPKPVATIALGKAMSAGASLLAAGSKGLRFASADSSIMIHEVSSGVFGKAAEIAESAAIISDLNKKLFNNLAKDCGQNQKKLLAKVHSKKNVDWTMSAKEAQELGLIDHIGIPRIASIAMPIQLVATLPHNANKGIAPKKKTKKP